MCFKIKLFISSELLFNICIFSFLSKIFSNTLGNKISISIDFFIALPNFAGWAHAKLITGWSELFSCSTESPVAVCGSAK